MLEQRSRDGAIGAFKAEVTEDGGVQQGLIIMSMDPAFPQPFAKDFLKNKFMIPPSWPQVLPSSSQDSFNRARESL